MKNPIKEKYIIRGKEAQEALLEGAKLMYDSVCTTLSPKGRNVAIQRPWGTPIVVHDGVTVAKEVKSENKFVMMGINLIKEAAQKTNEEAGDGTTTSTLLAYELIARGMKLKEAGVNPMILRDELYTELSTLKSNLANLSSPAVTGEELVQVATISSASKEIGEMVGKAVYEMGVEGLVTVEESNTYDTYLDKTDGMSIARGFLSPYFITDPNRGEATVSKPVVILTDKNITTQVEIVPILEFIIQNGHKNIVIIGEVGGVALQTMITNKMNGNINCLVIRPPGYGDNKLGFLEDLALITGGRVISKELGQSLADFTDLSFLGKADKISSDSKITMIVGGKGDKKEIDKQIKMLRAGLKGAKNPVEKEAYEERLAKMTTGVAVVRVGAKTETEAREKIERVKDAVGAAKSALEEGYVAGSGATFLRLAELITSETDGARLLKEVLKQPIIKVMDNCGESKKSIRELIQQVIGTKNPYQGYDALDGKIKDMYVAGIIDPTKVIRLCLENGIAVASSILTTDTLILNETTIRE